MDQLWLLLALAILYGGLLGVALWEWARQRQSRILSRWVWLLVILLVSVLGPAAYLLLGRERES